MKTFVLSLLLLATTIPAAVVQVETGNNCGDGFAPQFAGAILISKTIGVTMNALAGYLRGTMLQTPSLIDTATHEHLVACRDFLRAKAAADPAQTMLKTSTAYWEVTPEAEPAINANRAVLAGFPWPYPEEVVRL
jgi:hypothetical protein